MATRGQKIKLGVFLSASFALLLGTFAVFASQELWDEEVRYYVRFSESVSGLEPGAPVKLRGVRVGAVDSVRLDPENVEQVEVALSLEPGTPITRDSRASLMIQGITGLKFVGIHSGTDAAERLPPGSYIEEGASIMAKITGSAEDISIKAEKVLNNLLRITGRQNQERIERLLARSADLTASLDELTRHLDELTVELRDVLRENRQYIRGTMANVDRTTGEVGDLVVNANAVVEDVDSEALRESVESLTLTLNQFRGMLERGTQLMAQNEDQVRATLYNLRLAAQSLKEFGRSLQRQPSLLLFDESPKERKLP